jgi:hypothetical protein
VVLAKSNFFFLVLLINNYLFNKGKLFFTGFFSSDLNSRFITSAGGTNILSRPLLRKSKSGTKKPQKLPLAMIKRPKRHLLDSGEILHQIWLFEKNHLAML